MTEEFKPIDLSDGESLEIAEKIIEVLDSKKARKIKLLHVADNTSVTDYFVICSGTSNTQLKGFAGEVEYRLGQCKLNPRGIEGYNEAIWILMDYGNVIVHLFNTEARDFYKLEKLWTTAEEVDISNLLSEQ